MKVMQPLIVKEFKASENKILDNVKSLKNSKKLNIKEKEKKLKKVCEDFESLFINYMLKEMRKTIPKFDIVKKTNAMKIYESMKYENLAKELAHSGGIGLADILFDRLKQEIFSK